MLFKIEMIILVPEEPKTLREAILIKRQIVNTIEDKLQKNGDLNVVACEIRHMPTWSR